MDTRITPAPAGRSPKDEAVRFVSRDHPRACGEKFIARADSSSLLGSPPRLRGEVDATKQIPSLCRITPAPAGRSHSCEHPLNVFKDHPRACGEKFLTKRSAPPFSGSPPRLRGEAGAITGALFGGEDHPRACGEKCQYFQTQRYQTGSPPRLRGEGKSPIEMKCTMRITPAPAGRRNKE